LLDPIMIVGAAISYSIISALNGNQFSFIHHLCSIHPQYLQIYSP
jgi:hypothetical protein